MVLILGRLRRCSCIVKLALFSHPFMRSTIRTAGLIPNDRGPALLDRMEHEFACGRSVLIFPEGTRSPADGIHPFTRGAAHIAVRLRVPVVPIRVCCDQSFLGKGQPWYEVPGRSPRFVLSAGEPLNFGAVAGEPIGRTIRNVNQQLEAQFRKLV